MKQKRHYLDYSIFIPYLVLVLFGLVMVYSSTSYLQYMPLTKGVTPESYVKNQGLYLVLALVLMGVVYKMKTQFFQNKRLVQLIMIVMAILLILTRFTKLGKEINGAKGWLNIFGFSLQPVEYLKITVVWYLSYIYSLRQKTIQDSFKQVSLVPLTTIGALIFLVLIQPDVGGATILILLVAVMTLISGISYRISELVAIVGGILAVLGTEFIMLFGNKIPFVKDYIYNRFAVFKNPFVDSLNGGHQLANSYYALHNGGWWGLGLGNSIQKKGFLPEAHTDFIFSIVVEELGVIGALVLLGILFFMIIRILLVGIRSTKPFNSMMMMGIASLFLIQIFINLGGVLGLIPMTGVTFPFISQGGNSLLTLSLAVAFSLNISADEKRRKEQEIGNQPKIKPLKSLKKNKIRTI